MLDILKTYDDFATAAKQSVKKMENEASQYYLPDEPQFEHSAHLADLLAGIHRAIAEMQPHVEWLSKHGSKRSA